MDILRKKDEGKDEKIIDVFAEERKSPSLPLSQKGGEEKASLERKDVFEENGEEIREGISDSGSEKSGGTHSTGSGQAWDKIIKWSLYLIIGLTPLFFLPWGISQVDANKQFFLSVFAGIALIAWLAKSIASGKLVWKKSLLNPAIVVLLIFWGVSSYFSASPFQSLGFGFSEPDTFLNLLKYAVVFFLVGATFGSRGLGGGKNPPQPPFEKGGSREENFGEVGDPSLSQREVRRDLKKAIYIFLLPVAVLAVFIGFKFLNINLLPKSWDFAQGINFNPVGTTNSLALFLGAGLVLIVGLLGRKETRKNGVSGESLRQGADSRSLFQSALIVLAIIIAIELLLINFSPVWWALAGVMIFLTADGLMREMQLMRDRGGVLRIQKIILPVAILAVSALLLLVRLPISDVLSLPAEVSPSQSATYDIAKEVLKSKGGVANLFGSGPATFTYDYGLHRSADLNQTVFWGVRFSQGASLFLTALATTGVLGVVSLLFFVLAFGWQTLRSIKLSSAGGKKELPIILAAAALFLLIAWFFYQANFTLLVSAFILLGLLAAATSPQSPPYKGGEERGGSEKRRRGGLREISLLASPQRTLIISLLLIVLMVGAISAMYLEGQKYIAGLYYSAGINVYNQKGDFDMAFSKITKAINLNASKDLYWRTLSQMFLVKTSNILNDSAWQTNSAAVLEDLRSARQR